MTQSHASFAKAQATIANMVTPARIGDTHPISARFIHALRLIALHERLGRDPVPELAIRLGSIEVTAKALILAQAISASWPENIHVSRFCCQLLSHDEATIGAFVDAAVAGDRVGLENALTGLIRPDRMHHLWDGALGLVGAELRAV